MTFFKESNMSELNIGYGEFKEFESGGIDEKNSGKQQKESGVQENDTGKSPAVQKIINDPIKRIVENYL